MEYLIGAGLAVVVCAFAALVKFDRDEERDVQVTRFGDSAVVTGELDMKGTGATAAQGKWQEAPGKSMEGVFRFTRVWIRRDGSWPVAALHNAVPLHVQAPRP